MAKKIEPTTALASYDAQLAKLAEEAASREAGVGGGKFLSIRGGQLSLGGDPIPGNAISCVILDAVLENVFYEGAYDPDNPTSPNCFAFGKDEKAMAPHDDSAAKQADGCAACPMNQWGSSDKGRGKQCRNCRRVALIPYGSLDGRTGEYTADETGVEDAPIVMLKIPPTSLVTFANYTKKLYGGLRKPTCAVVTRLAVVPDAKTQVKVTFELLEELPVENIPVALARMEEAQPQLVAPYQPMTEQAAAPKGKKAKPVARRF
jgi:hypothetical protein